MPATECKVMSLLTHPGVTADSSPAILPMLLLINTATSTLLFTSPIFIYPFQNLSLFSSFYQITPLP